jgi:hypothetical protein
MVWMGDDLDSPLERRLLKSGVTSSSVTNPKALWLSIAHGEVVVWPAVATGLIVAGISLLVGPHRGDVRVDVAMASMAAFLFGLLLAFTIVRTRERLGVVQDLIARGDASLLTIHDSVTVFGSDESTEIRALIDQYLTSQIDYRLVDYHLATPSYRRLTRAVYDLDPKTAQQEAVYKELLALCFTMDRDRALIEAATGQSMSPIEWSGLFLLLITLLGLLAVLPGGTIPGALVAGVLAGTFATLMILLRKLDLLRWYERVTIWEPTTRLFKSMDLDPYIPRDVVDSGRYLPSGRVRIVDYPDVYPIRATKLVSVVDLNGSNGAR